MSDPAFPDEFPPIVSAAEMRELERAAIDDGAPEEALMDEAGAGMARILLRLFPKPAAAVVFAGKGHNAGDAFVLAGHLLHAGWTVNIRLAWPRGELRPLAAAKLAAIENRVTFSTLDAEDLPSRPAAVATNTNTAAGRLVILDGILGIGSGGELRGPAAEAVKAANALRERSHGITFAIDLPSGLGGSTSVLADVTLTLGWPKDGLFADSAAACVGRIVHIPLAKLPRPGGGLSASASGGSDRSAGSDRAPDSPARDILVTARALRSVMGARPLFSKHKGESGRVGIVAGSLGLTGAARLSATAASLMGGGLVTLFCPHNIYPILAAACPPEVMVRPVNSCLEVREFPLDAIGIGPGMGGAPLPYLTELLFHDPRPVIIDADALNALAAGPWLAEGSAEFAGPRLLTPHPGELARLIKRWNPHPVLTDRPRREQAQAFTDAFPVTLLAKSARSFVIGKGLPAAWNSSGHPLMARGGMGDVLTGFLTTFAAQKMPLPHAAALGSWVLGRGAELYHRASGGHSEPGTASEVMCFAAGPAMAELRA